MKPAVLAAVVAAVASGAQAQVTEFERAADEWMAAAPHAEARAFDEFYPGVQPGSGCMVPPPVTDPVVLKLAGGTVTVSAVDSGGAPICAIRDGSTLAVVSDGWIDAGGMVVMEFDPPISAFYAFYGSLQTGTQGAMTLFSGATQVDQITGAPSPNSANATGHGFVSPVPIDRIHFTSSEAGVTLLGAFRFLHPGEPSLGTVHIPGYGSDNGDDVLLDFACAFVVSVSEFESAADGWLAASPDAEARAFDEFYPGVQPGSGCMVPPPQTDPVVLKLAGGTVTVSAVDSGGAPICAVRDGSTLAVVSDGWIDAAGVFVMEFDPPISAFYAFYGSLATGTQGTMTLFSGTALFNPITGVPSPNSANATGHGFVSPVPIDRIHFTSSEAGVTLLGAFRFLHPGEPSLGTVHIPGYGSDNGDDVLLDFACAFVSVDPCPADASGDGVVNVGDLTVVILGWGACGGKCPGDVNGDGMVDVADMVAVILAWGVCP